MKLLSKILKQKNTTNISKLKIEKDVKIDNDEITKRIEKIRDGGSLVNEPVVKLKKEDNKNEINTKKSR